MIVYLSGILKFREALSCVVVTGGIGYEVFVPVTARLPELGQAVELFTYAVYREDNQALYGFNTKEERDFFKLVVEKVSGIGPKTALAMLSKYRLGELQQFIAQKDASMIATIPGIGKKTAEKLILELTDKVISVSSSAGNNLTHTMQSDAILGLIALGYKRQEAETLIRKAAQEFPEGSPEALIKAAIRVR